jgi:hypothetical protein
MQIYGKAVAAIESTDGDKFGPNGGFTAVLSTPTLDRDGDRLKKSEWTDLPEWLPLDIDHGMTVADTIGKFHPYWDGEKMLMDAYFASTAKAQDARTLIKDLSDSDGGGCPLGVSVAFLTDKSKKDGEPRRELLNAGVVGIPANKDAVILASKAASALRDAFSDTTDGEVPDEVKQAVLDALGTKDVEAKGLLEIFTKAVGGDASLVQAIHDASGHLGAQCMDSDDDEEPDVDEDSGASDGANKSFIVSKAAMSGSVDDLQSRVQDAVNSACDPTDYPWVRAVFLDDLNSGTVVYECSDETYARSFTDDGTTAMLGSDARAVAIVTSIVDERAAKSKKSDETDRKSSETTPEVGPDSEISIDGRKLSFDEFKAVALETSALESSADDAAAAQKAAAADEADEDVVDENRARRMEMLLFASESN